MVHKRTRDGIHRDKRDDITYTADEMKLMRTQDLTYINMRRSQERQKIDKLKADLHLLIDLGGEEDANGAGPATEPAFIRQHIVFVDSKKKG
jgi:U3 small nucleolar RNA-associated protein 11